ncbi:MAG: WecB/TagA/CpsF family glycosyltransferase [Fibrobacter sp.]|nr:WecB/TagA/CpsF family glycosyltransferase [Fibrobacter sp.]
MTKIILGSISFTPQSFATAQRTIVTQLVQPDAQPLMITYLNAFTYCMAIHNERLRNIINKSQIILADGTSIVQAVAFLHRIKLDRCIMTHAFDDFICLKKKPKCTAILIGGTLENALFAKNAINKVAHNLQITEALSGYMDEAYYKDFFRGRKEKYDILLVGMGTPKSEFLFDSEIIRNKVKIIWHIGGGTIDCFAGIKRRAPQWISKIGMEWCHRFIFEPHTRMRYIKTNFLFVILMIKEKIKNYFSSTALNHQKQT